MIAIVDYGMGNVGSILNMLRHIGADAAVASTPDALQTARALILPGVGSFDHGMRALRARRLDEVIGGRVVRDGVPVLGLCLGMQLLARSSEEGTTRGFGWLDADVVRFDLPPVSSLKVPHMGWSGLDVRRPHPIVDAVTAESRYYFAHSYHLRCHDQADIVATAIHAVEFPAVVARGNVVGLQCHPEKSHRFGMQMLTAFARMAAA